MNNNDRRTKGLEMLSKVNNRSEEEIMKMLSFISPVSDDLKNYIIDYSFGDIYSRTGLDLKSKEISVVAAMTALGKCTPQLKIHIAGALNTGSSAEELIEVILQMSAYAGFPRCINAMISLKEVFEEFKIINQISSESYDTNTSGNERMKKGEIELNNLFPDQINILNDTLGKISPDLVKFIIEFGYGDIYSRNILSKKHRQIATIAALTAMGNSASQLKFHIKAGMNIGLMAEEINEIMLLMSVFAGFPAAINGTFALKDVLDGKK
ncbi:MAG: carboxymuconolactone decarboxylase family protein [Spirochaetes bacterium]|nr:carboxymuconolactone decarboxylase family protein [Spirochaetota bacterium]